MKKVAQAALDRALDHDEQLLLVYQPIHELESRRVWAVEALLRQRRESGEIREASIIHEAAEDSSGPELLQLDSMLVQRAYHDAVRWQSQFDVRLNVNLSPREFEEGDVVARLTELIDRCGIDPRRVNIEITETSYIEHPSETMHVLDELRRTGVALWLDDFGTGFSSITHLQHFPLCGLKLPGSFVKPLPDDPRSCAIVANLIRLAHDLGLTVIAEEVETEAQLELLRSLRCDFIQGFLYSKPMELEPLSRFLEKNVERRRTAP